MRYKPLDPGFAPPLKLRRHAVARVTAFCETIKPGISSRWHPTFTQDTSYCRSPAKPVIPGELLQFLRNVLDEND